MHNSAAKSRITSVDYLVPGAAFALLGLLYFPALREIALICWNDEDYSHGLLLPFVAGYMVWTERERIANRVRAASSSRAWGMAAAEMVLIGGLLVFFVGAVAGNMFICWVSFFPVCLAVVRLVFGGGALAALAAPILLLFMAKPLPDSMVVRLFWPLQVLAAKVSGSVLRALDVPVYMSGNIIEIPQMRLLVEEACSGMRSVMAMLTLALIVVYFMELRLISKLALIGAAIGVAVVMNVLRVALTGVLAHFYDPAVATGFFHTFSGLVVFIVGLPILYYTGIGLTRLERKAASPGTDAAEKEDPKE